MAEFPFLPLATDAYLGDTTHLTTIEHGAYLLLLITMWRNKGTLPNDDKLLCRYTRLTPSQWKRIKPIIMPFFKVDEMTITQARLHDEMTAVKKNSRKQSKNARARWLKNKDNDDAMGMPNGCQTDAPTPTPTTTTKSLSKIAPEFALSMQEIESPFQEAFEAYNLEAKKHGWPVAAKLTETRKAHLKNRLKDCDGLEGWNIALEKASQSDFLCGRTKTLFKNTLDFMLTQSSFFKIMEGNYDNKNSRKETNAEKVFDAVDAILNEPEFDG